MSTPTWHSYDSRRLLSEHMERRRELVWRALCTRDRSTSAGDCPPLTVSEHLEVLAIGEALARYFRHPADIYDAVTAGATWRQVAAAIGADEQAVRRDYRAWADGQHHLYRTSGGKFGLGDAEYAAAMARAGEVAS